MRDISRTKLRIKEQKGNRGNLWFYKQPFRIGFLRKVTNPATHGWLMLSKVILWSFSHPNRYWEKKTDVKTSIWVQIPMGNKRWCVWFHGRKVDQTSYFSMGLASFLWQINSSPGFIGPSWTKIKKSKEWRTTHFQVALGFKQAARPQRLVN